MATRAARAFCTLSVLAAACSKPIKLEWTHEIGAPSVSTPLVTDSYVAFGHALGVTLVDTSGTKHCTFDAHGEVISAPKTDGNLIFFGSTNYIFYAIDSTCREKWKMPARDRIKSDALVADGRVYVSSYDGHLYALESSTGERLWVFPSNAPPKIAKVTPAPTPKSSNTGKKKKRRKKKRKNRRQAPEPASPAPPPTPVEVVKPGDFSYSSPYLHGGIIYVGNLDSHLYAIRASDGTLAWRFKTEGPVTSSPVVDGTTLYFGSNDGFVYAVDLKEPASPPPDGQPRRAVWKTATKDWVNSSPRIVDGVIYIGSNDRHLYALDAVTGSLKWGFSTAGPVIPIPSVYQNLVIAAAGSGDGRIFALQKTDGLLFWEYSTDGKIESDPVIHGDRIFVTSTDQKLYCFKILATTGG